MTDPIGRTPHAAAVHRPHPVAPERLADEDLTPIFRIRSRTPRILLRGRDVIDARCTRVATAAWRSNCQRRTHPRAVSVALRPGATCQAWPERFAGRPRNAFPPRPGRQA